MHGDSKYYLCIDSFTIIYAPVLSKNNGAIISPRIFEISLPFGAHGKIDIDAY
jgi:hypothetical protein